LTMIAIQRPSLGSLPFVWPSQLRSAQNPGICSKM
jgi:hypothetical protein